MSKKRRTDVDGPAKTTSKTDKKSRRKFLGGAALIGGGLFFGQAMALARETRGPQAAQPISQLSSLSPVEVRRLTPAARKLTPDDIKAVLGCADARPTNDLSKVTFEDLKSLSDAVIGRMTPATRKLSVGPGGSMEHANSMVACCCCSCCCKINIGSHNNND